MVSRGTGRFVGRGVELARLSSALAQATSGEPVGVLVGGEAGIGKSRLVEHLVTSAGVADQTFIGHCLPTNAGQQPYGPVVELLRRARHRLDAAVIDRVLGTGRTALATLLPELQRPDDPPATDVTQARLFELLLAAVHRLGTQLRPLVLVIEDLHWCDDASHAFAGFLVRNVEPLPLLLIGTYRDDALPGDPALRSLLVDLDRWRTERFELAPLMRSDLRELIAGITGVDPPADVVDAVARRSDGNPLLAEELAAALPAGSSDLPPSLRDLLLERLDQVGPHGRQLLDAAAVIGDNGDHRLVAAVSGLGDDDLDAAWHSVTAGRLVTLDGDQVRFRHALMREAVVDQLVPTVRTRLHRRCAESLRDSSELLPDAAARTVELARHWDGARQPQEALHARIAAGAEAARVHAHGAAWEQYERAVALAAEVAPGEAPPGDLVVAAARAALESAAPERVVAVFEPLLERVDPIARAWLRRILAPCHFLLGDGAGMYRMAADGLAELPADAPNRLRAQLLHTDGFARMHHLHDFAGARARADQALRLLRHGAGEPTADTEADALNLRALADLDLGDPQAAVDTLQRAHAVALAGGAYEPAVRSDLNLSHGHLILLQHADAAASARRGLELADRFGLLNRLGPLLLGNLASALVAAGRFDDCRDSLAAMAPPRPTGVGAMTVLIAHCLLHIRCGELDAADAVRRRIEALGVPADAEDALVLAELALWRNRPDRARALCADHLAWDADLRSGAHWPPLTALWLRAAADSVDVAAPSQRDELRASLVEQGDPRARALGTWPVDGAMPAHRALAAAELARLRRDPDEDAAWTAVREAFDAASMPFEAAYARWRLAQAVLNAGRRRRARDELAAGSRVASDIGAGELARQIALTALAAGIGLDARPGAPPPHRDDAPLGLTPREHEVLLLLAVGRSNPEIAAELYVSRKTAATHVSSILRKLGVSSRGEAAAMAHRAGLLDADRVRS